MTGLASIITVAVLALAGHAPAAAAVGVIGGGMSAAGGIQVTIHVRR
ncbi:hypothetical protein [Streptomyces sp. NPDC050564]